ncbi:hypothetical protein NXS19_007810 [Fusarium pseudograminearum]|nr:hypothetical protein NXS19_007810 [Fusarium pseudograminearum]
MAMKCLSILFRIPNPRPSQVWYGLAMPHFLGFHTQFSSPCHPPRFFGRYGLGSSRAKPWELNFRLNSLLTFVECSHVQRVLPDGTPRVAPPSVASSPLLAFSL